MVRPCNMSSHHCSHPKLHEPRVQIASMPSISKTSTLVTLFQIDSLMTCLQGEMHNATKMQRKCKKVARKHVKLGYTCIPSIQSQVEHRHDQDLENECFPSSHFDTLLIDMLKASQGDVSSGTMFHLVL